jgi:SAM-dependent methyltransferase
VRQPVRSALDVGTGSGILALVASMHSQRVTAVDINPRALNFTAFNALMKGAFNVECLQGSFFEPVKGRKFDLIVSNPPFIISPEYRVEFRDSQLPGDSVCKEIIRQAPDYLEEGGFAHVIFNWVHGQDDDWSAPLKEWVEGNGCDALLLRIGTRDAQTYAAILNDDMKRDNPDAYQPTIDRWIDYYQKHDIQAISYGVIILRRRSCGANWFLAESLPAGDILPSSEHILRIFEARDYLSGLGSGLDLLVEALALVEDHRAEPEFVDSDGDFKITGVQISLNSGLRLQCIIDPYTYRVLHRCDGQRRLGEVIGGLARIWEIDEAQLAQVVMPVLRKLMELGFVSRSQAM